MSENPTVAVATDSVACLPRELVQRYAIRVIPLNIILEGRVYRDGVDMTPSDVYEALKQGIQLPTTSAPSPGEVIEVYRELSRWASSILCITDFTPVMGVHTGPGTIALAFYGED